MHILELMALQFTVVNLYPATQFKKKYNNWRCWVHKFCRIKRVRKGSWWLRYSSSLCRNFLLNLVPHCLSHLVLKTSNAANFSTPAIKTSSSLFLLSEYFLLCLVWFTFCNLVWLLPDLFSIATERIISLELLFMRVKPSFLPSVPQTEEHLFIYLSCPRELWYPDNWSSSSLLCAISHWLTFFVVCSAHKWTQFSSQDLGSSEQDWCDLPKTILLTSYYAIFLFDDYPKLFTLDGIDCGHLLCNKLDLWGPVNLFTPCTLQTGP